MTTALPFRALIPTDCLEAAPQRRRPEPQILNDDSAVSQRLTAMCCGRSRIAVSEVAPLLITNATLIHWNSERVREVVCTT